MGEVGKRGVGGAMCLLCYPTIRQVEPLQVAATDIKGFSSNFSSLCLEEEEGFLPSDGSGSTEAVVGFVSHHRGSSTGGRGLVTCVVYLCRSTMARWINIRHGGTVDGGLPSASCLGIVGDL